ncbi:killer cell lectin-like receptor subfamily B member 1B allele C [Mixophyes fleayi]|uniref:killer cell lectin-like receptor subfamily B member 1B allele C n=1 Tax=Mixophyes fleayi TaxID=3061075 RepID=UPI003F4E3CE4
MDTPDKTLQTKLWIPSWKFVIITVLIGANIIFIRIIEMLGCILCPYNWLLYGDTCYYYSDVTQRTWNQSQDHCEMMGAHLLVIEDQEPQVFIHQILTEETDDMFWIGLYHEGDGWRWVNGSHYNTSLFQLEVNSGNCALMNKHSYRTNICNSRYRFICQKTSVKI